MTRAEARLFLLMSIGALVVWTTVALSWDRPDGTASMTLYTLARQYPALPLALGLAGGLAMARLMKDRDWVDQAIVILTAGGLAHFFWPIVG